MPNQKEFTLNGSRYNQSTYWGRFAHFISIIDPSTLFATKKEVEAAKNLLHDYQSGRVLPQSRIERNRNSLEPDDAIIVPDETLWKAKKLIDATLHPDTGKEIPRPFRMSAFVPMNVPICAGILFSSAKYAPLFWQWVNQTYNVTVNYANRNASGQQSSNTRIVAAYFGAVATCCGLVLGLARFQRRPGFLGIFVPYLCVASASAVNVMIIRSDEARKGILVRSIPEPTGHDLNRVDDNSSHENFGTVEQIEDGNGKGYEGISKVAGRHALAQVTISRIFLSLPVMGIPPIAVWALNKFKVGNNSIIMKLSKLVVISFSLAIGLPLSIALFPQVAPISAQKLEPQFHNLVDPVTKKKIE